VAYKSLSGQGFILMCLEPLRNSAVVLYRQSAHNVSRVIKGLVMVVEDAVVNKLTLAFAMVRAFEHSIEEDFSDREIQ
jgi:hypothetical protein